MKILETICSSRTPSAPHQFTLPILTHRPRDSTPALPTTSVQRGDVVRIPETRGIRGSNAVTHLRHPEAGHATEPKAPARPDEGENHSCTKPIDYDGIDAERRPDVTAKEADPDAVGEFVEDETLFSALETWSCCPDNPDPQIRSDGGVVADDTEDAAADRTYTDEPRRTDWTMSFWG